MEALKRVRAVVSDVDGVMSDGSIVVGEAGETKVFNVRDGMAIKLLQRSGLQFAILSGRLSPPVVSRSRELGIDVVVTGRNDKEDALNEISNQLGIPTHEMVYIGDDLPDLAPLKMAAVGFCPQDSVAEVLAAADVVVPVDGGRGVVRHVAEVVLKAQGLWDNIVASFEVKS